MKKLFTSCFGLGWLPVAPGTWGSLPPTIVFALMCYLNASVATVSIIMAALALAGSVVCVKFAPAVIASTGKTDPREVVADEFAGQAITFLAVSFSTIPTLSASRIWIIALLGFVVFRLFDIVKPWPIRNLEKLPNGWGILSDDLLAGVYAGIVVVLCYTTGLIEYLSRLF